MSFTKVCVPTTTVVGDGVDNDCDGLIDEELCTTENKGAGEIISIAQTNNFSNWCLKV